ncbi:FadR/GntR family transcriptional regulator [Vibrio sp. NTOU-M3]|uniref:FadR/GntR family transcriptional regulator n=1 Tax=Vibrio sp. NTOU-M3 TaxID=3234954 RepID=UPI00349F6B3E
MSVNERLYIKVASDILAKIQQKEIEVGTRIPPERKLSDELRVSRTVIREAMVYLELIGVAEIKKGSGVYVVNDKPIQLPSDLPEVTPYEVTFARRSLESQLAALAAEHATDKLIGELENCLVLMESAKCFSTAELRKSASVDADMQFHKLIAQASNNPFLIKFHEELMKHHMGGTMWNRLNIMADEPAERGIWTTDHRVIFEAIKARDPKAAFEAMENHLNNVITEIT